MREYRLTHRVLFGETDAAGIVFYPNYYRWFDQATHELFRALGYRVPIMFADGIVIPLVEAKARFLASLRYDDEITIVSRIEEVRTRSFRIEHRVMRDGSAVCTGYEVRMWVRQGVEGITPEPLPDTVRRLLLAE